MRSDVPPDVPVPLADFAVPVDLNGGYAGAGRSDGARCALRVLLCIRGGLKRVRLAAHFAREEQVIRSWTGQARVDRDAVPRVGVWVPRQLLLLLLRVQRIWRIGPSRVVTPRRVAAGGVRVNGVKNTGPSPDRGQTGSRAPAQAAARHAAEQQRCQGEQGPRDRSHADLSYHSLPARAAVFALVAPRLDLPAVTGPSRGDGVRAKPGRAAWGRKGVRAPSWISATHGALRSAPLAPPCCSLSCSRPVPRIAKLGSPFAECCALLVSCKGVNFSPAFWDERHARPLTT